MACVCAGLIAGLTRIAAGLAAIIGVQIKKAEVSNRTFDSMPFEFQMM
jgi:hypothetical protein